MSTPDDIGSLSRTSDWSGVRAVVAGFGVSGFAAADNLLFLSAQVTALDETSDAQLAEQAQLLESLGATIRLGAGSTATLPEDTDKDTVPDEPGGANHDGEGNGTR